MAEQTRTIFNQRAAEKLRSPDDLDKYVRVTNPLGCLRFGHHQRLRHRRQRRRAGCVPALGR